MRFARLPGASGWRPAAARWPAAWVSVAASMSSPATRARALLTPTGVFALLVPVALILIVWFGRGTIPLPGDWRWISHGGPGTGHFFFEPPNDRFSVVRLAI